MTGLRGPKGDTGSSGSDGGSCFGCVLSLLVLAAILFGLATPWGTLHIDFFPPAIRLEGTTPAGSGAALGGGEGVTRRSSSL